MRSPAIARWHHTAGAVADVDLPEILDAGAVVLLALDIDLPNAAEQVEVVDVDAAERRLQCGEHVGHRQPQRLRLLAVDIEEQGRVGGGEGGEHPG
jgi:hypothetical protein